MNFSPAPSQPVPGSFLPRLKASLFDAARFWEPRRILYTLLLATVLAAWVIFSWPHFHIAFNPLHLFQLFVLAVLANACYSIAYLLDIPLQRSLTAAALLRLRWTLWVLGMLFAILLENYWIADEIYPFVS